MIQKINNKKKNLAFYSKKKKNLMKQNCKFKKNVS